jgi:hypothetical protein
MHALLLAAAIVTGVARGVLAAPSCNLDAAALCSVVGPPPPGCSALAPSGDPEVDWRNITACLCAGAATLGPGTFQVSRGILVPPGAGLLGDLSYPTIRLAANGGCNYLVGVRGDSQVALLRLDGDNRLPVGCCSAVVSVMGDDNLVNDNHVFNGAVPPRCLETTGVYVFGGTGNVVLRNQIYHHFHGVLFAASLTSANVNTLDRNGIYDNKCDGLTLIGFGRVVNNDIYRNGWQCENAGGNCNDPGTPVPGGGIYSLGNRAGAEIVGNRIWDSCGANLDLDRIERFVIRGNHAYDPGYQWPGQSHGPYPYCVGISAMLLDASRSTVEDNVIENVGRAWNRVGNGAFPDTNGIFCAAPPPNSQYCDLPSGGNQAIAFFLANRRPRGCDRPLAIGNVIRNNAMRASCPGSCVGLGYFASRGTGFAADGTWSASTTNYYTLNRAFGSEIGSKRCGGNWYAANSTCTQGASPPECNDDDYQHDPPAGDWARNDFCPSY